MQRTGGGIYGWGEYSIRFVRRDLFTVHRPAFAATYGEIIGVHRTLREAKVYREKASRLRL